MQHLTTLCDLTTPEVEHIFSITEDLKTKYTAGLREPLLPGRVMALLFEKPSLRTRVSFESGMDIWPRTRRFPRLTGRIATKACPPIPADELLAVDKAEALERIRRAIDEARRFLSASIGARGPG